MKARTPGGCKEWKDSLPGALSDDPEVIVSLIPDTAQWATATFDGYTLGLIELSSTKEQMGLQVLSPPLDEYPQQADVMRRAGIKMINPVFVGPLSELPQRVLMHEGMCPVVMLRHHMSRKFFNLRAWYLLNRVSEEWLN